MKIGFSQFSPRRGDVNANLSTISAALEDCEFDLIVLPELASTGYLFDDPAELYELSEPGDGSGVTLSGLIELAARHRACIVSGFSERAPEGLVQFSRSCGRKWRFERLPKGAPVRHGKRALFAG